MKCQHAIAAALALLLSAGCDVVRRPFQAIESITWSTGNATYHAGGGQVSKQEFDASLQREITKQ